MITQNALFARRDMFQADDIKYLKWLRYEATVSTTVHGVISICLCIWSTSNDHHLFDHLNACAQGSLQDKLPYFKISQFQIICTGIACMAVTHLVLTLIYVRYLPHVWNLHPKKLCPKSTEQEALEDNEIRNETMPMT